MNETIDLITNKQKTKIKTLAEKGCSIHEVGTALGYTEGQFAAILENEFHPFNQTYWQEKVKFAGRLRDIAMKIAETSEDDAVRVRIIEFFSKENSEAFENKRLHTGYTNIRKLLSLVRQQFEHNPDGSKNPQAIERNRSRIRREKAKEGSDGQ